MNTFGRIIIMTRRISIGFVLLALLSITGCAVNKPVEAQRLKAISSIEVVRIATPEIQRHSGATIAGGGLLFGGFGMEAVGEEAGKELRERCKLDDFGVLVTREFIEQVPKQIPGWPIMRVREAPVEAGYVAKDAYMLQFQPGVAMLYTFGAFKGFSIAVTATIASPSGEELWKYNTFYSQKKAGREREIEELEADSCKLLKEEMQHAARVIAGQCVTDLSGQKR
jgi:hypothetical protein